MFKLLYTHTWFSLWARSVLAALFFISSFYADILRANTAYAAAAALPLTLSPAFAPACIKGIKINPENPFAFEFIVDSGTTRISSETFKSESEKLVRYFLAGLTIPEKDLWVNLSPYERDKMTSLPLAQTDAGKDLLEQDYVLKQLTASLTYPESPLGKEFWEKARKRSQELFGTAAGPLNTFNKVWILPTDATIYADNDKVFLTDLKFKVLLEQDYWAMQNNPVHGLTSSRVNELKASNAQTPQPNNSITTQVMKEVILPILQEEVNTGKHFANLRQICYSLVLAAWFKKKLRTDIEKQINADAQRSSASLSALFSVYIDNKKTKGIETPNPAFKEKIYQQYLEAYTKGVYNYIKKEFESSSKKQVRRRYFSGGMQIDSAALFTRPDNLITPHAQTMNIMPAMKGAINAVHINIMPAHDAPTPAITAAEDYPFTIAASPSQKNTTSSTQTKTASPLQTKKTISPGTKPIEHRQDIIKKILAAYHDNQDIDAIRYAIEQLAEHTMPAKETTIENSIAFINQNIKNIPYGLPARQEAYRFLGDLAAAGIIHNEPTLIRAQALVTNIQLQYGGSLHGIFFILHELTQGIIKANAGNTQKINCIDIGLLTKISALDNSESTHLYSQLYALVLSMTEIKETFPQITGILTAPFLHMLFNARDTINITYQELSDFVKNSKEIYKTQPKLFEMFTNSVFECIAHPGNTASRRRLQAVFADMTGAWENPPEKLHASPVTIISGNNLFEDYIIPAVSVATKVEDLPMLQQGYIRLVHITVPRKVESILKKGFNFKYSADTTTRGWTNAAEVRYHSDDSRFHHAKGLHAVVVDVPVSQYRMDTMPAHASGKILPKYIVGVVKSTPESTARAAIHTKKTYPSKGIAPINPSAKGNFKILKPFPLTINSPEMLSTLSIIEKAFYKARLPSWAHINPSKASRLIDSIAHRYAGTNKNKTRWIIQQFARELKNDYKRIKNLISRSIEPSFLEKQLVDNIQNIQNQYFRDILGYPYARTKTFFALLPFLSGFAQYHSLSGNIFLPSFVDTEVLRWLVAHEEFHANTCGFTPQTLDEGATEYFTTKMFMMLAGYTDFSQKNILDFYLKHSNYLAKTAPLYAYNYTGEAYPVAGILLVANIVGEEALAAAWVQGDYTKIYAILGEKKWNEITKFSESQSVLDKKYPYALADILEVSIPKEIETLLQEYGRNLSENSQRRSDWFGVPMSTSDVFEMEKNMRKIEKHLDAVYTEAWNTAASPSAETKTPQNVQTDHYTPIAIRPTVGSPAKETITVFNKDIPLTILAQNNQAGKIIDAKELWKSLGTQDRLTLFKTLANIYFDANPEEDKTKFNDEVVYWKESLGIFNSTVYCVIDNKNQIKGFIKWTIENPGKTNATALIYLFATQQSDKVHKRGAFRGTLLLDTVIASVLSQRVTTLRIRPVSKKAEKWYINYFLKNKIRYRGKNMLYAYLSPKTPSTKQPTSGSSPLFATIRTTLSNLHTLPAWLRLAGTGIGLALALTRTSQAQKALAIDNMAFSLIPGQSNESTYAPFYQRVDTENTRLIPAGPGSDKDIARLIRQAAAALIARDYAYSRLLCETILSINPDCPQAHFLLAKNTFLPYINRPNSRIAHLQRFHTLAAGSAYSGNPWEGIPESLQYTSQKDLIHVIRLSTASLQSTPNDTVENNAESGYDLDNSQVNTDTLDVEPSDTGSFADTIAHARALFENGTSQEDSYKAINSLEIIRHETKKTKTELLEALMYSILKNGIKTNNPDIENMLLPATDLGPILYDALAVEYMSTGQFTKAIDILEKLEQYDFDEYRLGLAYLLRGKENDLERGIMLWKDYGLITDTEKADLAWHIRQEGTNLGIPEAIIEQRIDEITSNFKIIEQKGDALRISLRNQRMAAFETNLDNTDYSSDQWLSYGNDLAETLKLTDAYSRNEIFIKALNAYWRVLNAPLPNTVGFTQQQSEKIIAHYYDNLIQGCENIIALHKLYATVAQSQIPNQEIANAISFVYARLKQEKPDKMRNFVLNVSRNGHAATLNRVRDQTAGSPIPSPRSQTSGITKIYFNKLGDDSITKFNKAIRNLSLPEEESKLIFTAFIKDKILAFGFPENQDKKSSHASIEYPAIGFSKHHETDGISTDDRGYVIRGSSFFPIGEKPYVGLIFDATGFTNAAYKNPQTPEAVRMRDSLITLARVFIEHGFSGDFAVSGSTVATYSLPQELFQGTAPTTLRDLAQLPLSAEQTSSPALTTSPAKRDVGGIDVDTSKINIKTIGTAPAFTISSSSSSLATFSLDPQTFQGFTFTIVKIEALDKPEKIFAALH